MSSGEGVPRYVPFVIYEKYTTPDGKIFPAGTKFFKGNHYVDEENAKCFAVDDPNKVDEKDAIYLPSTIIKYELARGGGRKRRTKKYKKKRTRRSNRKRSNRKRSNRRRSKRRRYY
jgi:hypothetical protein